MKLFSKNLIDLAFKTSQSVRKTKKYYLILEVTVSSLESYFLDFIFFNIYLVIHIF